MKDSYFFEIYVKYILETKSYRWSSNYPDIIKRIRPYKKVGIDTIDKIIHDES